MQPAQMNFHSVVPSSLEVPTKSTMVCASLKTSYNGLHKSDMHRACEQSSNLVWVCRLHNFQWLQCQVWFSDFLQFWTLIVSVIQVVDLNIACLLMKRVDGGGYVWFVWKLLHGLLTPSIFAGPTSECVQSAEERWGTMCLSCINLCKASGVQENSDDGRYSLHWCLPGSTTYPSWSWGRIFTISYVPY